MRPGTEVAAFLGGFVAAEGTFVQTGERFRFAVALGAHDLRTCELLRDFLGVGTVRVYARRAVQNDDEAIFAVQAIDDLVDVVVPFLDEHLPPSFKREQFRSWRSCLLDRAARMRRGRTPCSVDGCDDPVRASGYCRAHLYRCLGR